MTPPGSGGTAMPSRWQIDILVYENEYSYPVLLLQPGRHDDHRRLFGLLAGAGLAVPTTWEWKSGLWPLAAGCLVELGDGPVPLTVHTGEHSISAGFQLAETPVTWLAAASRQQQVLFVLLPPRPHVAEALIVDDVGDLNLPAERDGCLAGAIPLATG